MEDVYVMEDVMEVYRPNWDDIVVQSIKVSLHIAYWRAQAPLAPHDLGFDGGDNDFVEFLKKNISLGTKRLLPKKRYQELRRIERQARERVSRLGHPLDLERGAYLVGKDVYMKKIRPYLEQKRVEFFSARDEIVAHRDDIIAEMRKDYAKAAVAAYKIRNGLPLAHPVMPPDDFVEDFVEQVIRRIPPADFIHESFEFYWRPAYVETPEELELSKAKAAEIRREREILEARAWAEQEKERLDVEAYRQKLLQEEALDREIRQQRAAELRKQMKQTTDLVVNNIRSILYETVVSALESHRKNGGLVNRTITGLSNLAERLTALNEVVGDSDIEKYAQIINDLSKRQGDERNRADVEHILKQLAIAARGEMLSLGLSPRTARHLHIPDTIDDGRVRQARLSLGLSDAPSPQLDIGSRKTRAHTQPDAVQLKL